MRIACVLIPRLAIELERLRNPKLADQPVIIYEGNTVVEASSEAAGVQQGLTLRHAKGLYPRAVYVGADHARYRQAAEAVSDAIEAFSPLVEPAGLGVVYADIRGLEGHYTDEFALAGALVNAVRNATGLLPSVGIAGGKSVAFIAASVIACGDAGVVGQGREQEFVADKSVSLLPCSPAVIQRLGLLALRTLGDVAALPGPAVEAQFGSSGGRLWELANGIDREPLRPRRRREVLSERLRFEAPVVTNEALVMAGRQLVSRLVRRLRGRTARRMHIQLLTDDRIVWERLETFREPAGDERRMLLLLKTRLTLLALPQPVETVAVTLSGIGREVGKQAKLFTDTQQNLDQIGEAIRQLRARYGRDVVGRIVEVDPWSRHPEERSVLVAYDA